MSTLTDLADSASEAVRALNHRTITPGDIPVPDIYSVTSSLAEMAERLPQLLGQLARTLDTRANLGTLRLDWTGQERFACPNEAIASARTDLAAATQGAHALAAALDNAIQTLATIGDNHDPADQ